MQSVDEQPETIHLYVVRETDNRPPLYPIVFSALEFVALVLFCALTQFQQPVTRAVIRTPAVPLSIKTFTAQAAIVPTGITTYPATPAHGVLTITNGSIIGQSIPAGFTVQGVATDSVVYIPPGNANGYGWAQVSAHTLIPGKGGNLATFTINAVIGSSVYVRNLRAFVGGRDAYSVKYATAQDKQRAAAKVRNLLLHMSPGLHIVTNEAISVSKAMVSISWRCQILTYHIASFYHVTGIKIIGKNLLISVWFVPRPVRYWVK